MPDYLGDDKRRVKSDAGDGDKIQGEAQFRSFPTNFILFLFNAHP